MSRLRLLALTALVLLSGCQRADFSALSTPPPDREASLDDSDKDSPTMRLSRGVALAFSCEYKNKPCEGASARVDGSKRIQVMRTYVDQLSQADYYDSPGSKPLTSFVVVGMAEGKATLTVTVDDHDYDFDVAVVASP